MMTCVSDRSGMASRVMFLIEYNPANVAIPMKRKAMNLFRAQNSIILSIIASLLVLRRLMLRMGFSFWLCLRLLLHLMLRVIFGPGRGGPLPALSVLRMIRLRRRFIARRSAAAVAHAGHTHSARRRLQPAFGIDQEVGRSNDLLTRLQAAENDEVVIHLRPQPDFALLEIAAFVSDEDQLLRTRIHHRFLRHDQASAVIDLQLGVGVHFRPEREI